MRLVTDGSARIDMFSGNNTKYVMSSVHSFTDNNSDVALRIASSGKIGIGTVNPTARLQVVGSSGTALKTNGDISLTTYNGDTKIDMGDDYLQLLSPNGEVQIGDPEFDQNGTSVIVDDVNTKVVIPTGNVGIGTTSPSEKLEVDGNVNISGGIYPANLKYTYQASNANTYNGENVDFGTFSSGTSFASGDLIVYNYNSFNQSTNWILADNDSDLGSTGMIGIAAGTTASAGILLRGYARNTKYSSNNTTGLGSSAKAGNKVYIDGTSGKMTVTIPTQGFVRIVGYIVEISSTYGTIFLCPDNTYVEIP
jgi:hypothetical protein